MSVEPRDVTFFIVRLFHPDEEMDYYVRDRSTPGSMNRLWGWSVRPSHAYRFERRSDARGALRGAAVRRKLEKGLFWEICKVTEQRTYVIEPVVSDAPAMMTLARAGS